MSFKKRLTTEQYEHFKTLNKPMLRSLRLTEDEICMLYNLDDGRKYKVGTSLAILAAFVSADPLTASKMFDSLITYWTNSDMEHGFKPMELFLYLKNKPLDCPEIDEMVELEMYFNMPEHLNNLIKMRTSFRNALNKMIALNIA